MWAIIPHTRGMFIRWALKHRKSPRSFVGQDRRDRHNMQFFVWLGYTFVGQQALDWGLGYPYSLYTDYTADIAA